MSKLHPFHQYPLHLYHENKAPLIVYSQADEDKARAEGYGDTYIHQGSKFTKEELAAKAGVTYVAG